MAIKSQLNQLLKQHFNYQQIRYYPIGYIPKGRSISNRKGIPGPSISPMDVSNIYKDKCQQITKDLRQLVVGNFNGVTYEHVENGINIYIPINEKQSKFIKLKCNWYRYPTYYPHENMDNMYQTYWLVIEKQNI